MPIVDSEQETTLLISADIYIQDYSNPQNFNRYSYAWNNPLRYTDPTGWWTKGDGFNINAGLGIGISIQVIWAHDDNGNTAPVVTVGFFATIMTVSVTHTHQETDADTVSDLGGWSTAPGGSASYVISYGRDAVMGQDDSYTGHNDNWGLGIGLPIDVHTTVDYSWVMEEPEPVPSHYSSDTWVDPGDWTANGGSNWTTDTSPGPSASAAEVDAWANWMIDQC